MQVDKALFVKEPVFLTFSRKKAEAGELAVWYLSLRKLKFVSESGKVLQDLEEVKKQKQEFFAETEIKIEEIFEILKAVYGEEKFVRRKIKYLKDIYKRLITKEVFEIKCEEYREQLANLGFEYLLEKWRICQGKGLILLPAIELIEISSDRILRIRFNRHLAPILSNLKSWFNLLRLDDILALKKRHSIILYTIANYFARLGKGEKVFELKIETFKWLLNIPEIPNRNISSKVLKPAVKEINENTMLNISYTPNKTGKEQKITGIKFKVVDLNNYKVLLENPDLFRQWANKIVKKLGLEKEFLLSLKVSPSVALWFILHFSEEGLNTALQVLEKLKQQESDYYYNANDEIKNPEAWLIKQIKERKKDLEWLLDVRVKEVKDF